MSIPRERNLSLVGDALCPECQALAVEWQFNWTSFGGWISCITCGQLWQENRRGWRQLGVDKALNDGASLHALDLATRPYGD